MSQYEPKEINKEGKALYKETSIHKYRKNVKTRKPPVNAKTNA